MPIQWISQTAPTAPIWLLQTASTIAPHYWSPNATTAATTTVWTTCTDSGTGGAWGILVHGGRRLQLISPQRLYIARRSYQQALDDELRDLYQQETRRQNREMELHHEAARNRSLELLLQHLTPAQRETFEKNKWFIVEGGKSGQKYRIRNAGHMVANIDVLDDERVNHRLCGHCDLSEVPIFDQLLAQKLMLEYDEERFLRLANKHRAAA